jgi:hypothetical protein
VFDFLARNFMVCDRWFSSIPGPTWPNRQYLYAGHSNTLYDNCFHSVWGPRNYRERMPDRTIFDCLDEAGVDWMIYRGSVVSWPQLIPGFTAKGQGRGRVRPYRQLAVDTDPVPNPFESSPAAPAGDPAYRLPPVVIVDPDHNAKAKRTGRHNDDQAPSDIARGQQLIGEVYEIVRKQADRGRRPLLVITYDEHGGFFDHEPPDDLVRDQWVMGTPPSDRSAEELEELAKLANRKDLPGVQRELAEFGDLRATWPLFTRYGVRVPALVISPFVDAGSVWCWRLDHLSLTKSILLRFCPGVELIGEKRTKTNDQPAAFRARLDGAANLGHLLTLPEPRLSWPSAEDAIEQARRGAPVAAASRTRTACSRWRCSPSTGASGDHLLTQPPASFRVQLGSPGPSRSATREVGSRTSHGSPTASSTSDRSVMAVISATSGASASLLISGGSAPAQIEPVVRKYSTPSSKPGRAATSTRAAPARRNSANWGSRSSNASRCSQLARLAQK